MIKKHNLNEEIRKNKSIIRSYVDKLSQKPVKVKLLLDMIVFKPQGKPNPLIIIDYEDGAQKIQSVERTIDNINKYVAMGYTWITYETPKIKSPRQNGGALLYDYASNRFRMFSFIRIVHLPNNITGFLEYGISINPAALPDAVGFAETVEVTISDQTFFMDANAYMYKIQYDKALPKKSHEFSKTMAGRYDDLLILDNDREISVHLFLEENMHISDEDNLIPNLLSKVYEGYIVAPVSEGNLRVKDRGSLRLISIEDLEANPETKGDYYVSIANVIDIGNSPVLLGKNATYSILETVKSSDILKKILFPMMKKVSTWIYESEELTLEAFVDMLHYLNTPMSMVHRNGYEFEDTKMVDEIKKIRETLNDGDMKQELVDTDKYVIVFNKEYPYWKKSYSYTIYLKEQNLSYEGVTGFKYLSKSKSIFDLSDPNEEMSEYKYPISRLFDKTPHVQKQMHQINGWSYKINPLSDEYDESWHKLFNTTKQACEFFLDETSIYSLSTIFEIVELLKEQNIELSKTDIMKLVGLATEKEGSLESYIFILQHSPIIRLFKGSYESKARIALDVISSLETGYSDVQFLELIMYVTTQENLSDMLMMIKNVKTDKDKKDFEEIFLKPMVQRIKQENKKALDKTLRIYEQDTGQFTIKLFKSIEEFEEKFGGGYHYSNNLFGMVIHNYKGEEVGYFSVSCGEVIMLEVMPEHKDILLPYIFRFFRLIKA